MFYILFVKTKIQHSLLFQIQFNSKNSVNYYLNLSLLLNEISTNFLLCIIQNLDQYKKECFSSFL
ncbi:hypothetical protein CHRYSEO8AT_550073 [Chryseobacterium sp. 8AT]|nr:hypothetical protein CHRYSEO8AT_550073 [Chryseobacterium sp. 8AT]